MNINNLQLTPDCTLLYVGEDEKAGPLPALVYFALSAEDSLGKDPYNQPVSSLSSLPLRIFSLTLPAHEKGLPPENALAKWAEAFADGRDVLSPFFDRAHHAITSLLQQNWITPGHLAVAGLSRGAFVAAHVAARCPEVSTLLGFAPLISLAKATEFSALATHPLVLALDLHHLTPHLYNRNIRFYSGNNDRRVGTERAFSFMHTLAQEAERHRIRSSPIELIIGPSVGYQGHGTPPDRFQSGARYLKEFLL